MARHLTPPSTVIGRPLDEWGPISVELLGTQTRIVTGERWHHRVIETGEGEPLLLYHGMGGHAETWARNLHNLGRHFHVYAVDLLFHGYSSKDGWNQDRWIQIQADGVVDLIDALGHERVHVEGESLGAEVAFDFAARYPSRVGKLILSTGLVEPRPEPASAPAQPDDAEKFGALQKLSWSAVTDPTFSTLRSRLEWLVHKPERMTDEMVRIRQRLYEDPEINAAMRLVYRVGEPWDMASTVVDPAVMASLTADTLVFWTEHNPGDGPERGEQFADQLPNATFYNMLDAGHWPQWEKPEEHDQVVIAFIAGGV